MQPVATLLVALYAVAAVATRYVAVMALVAALGATAVMAVNIICSFPSYCIFSVLNQLSATYLFPKRYVFLNLLWRYERQDMYNSFIII
jgi:hypothetical protein